VLAKVGKQVQRLAAVGTEFAVSQGGAALFAKQGIRFIDGFAMGAHVGEASFRGYVSLGLLLFFLQRLVSLLFFLFFHVLSRLIPLTKQR